MAQLIVSIPYRYGTDTCSYKLDKILAYFVSIPYRYGTDTNGYKEAYLFMFQFLIGMVLILK